MPLISKSEQDITRKESYTNSSYEGRHKNPQQNYKTVYTMTKWDIYQ